MVEVVVVGPEDYPAIATFMAGFPGVKARSIEGWLSRLRTWWDMNPAFQDTFPRGWMLRDGGRITGFFGSLPLKFQLAGEETTVFAATSWRVFPEYRGKSIVLKMRQLSAHKEQLHFSTTPLEELVPLLERLGYHRIPRGPATDSQSQLILDAGKFWRGRLRDVPFGGVLATLAAPALGAVQALRTRGLGAVRGDVRELARADEGFDDLWRRTRARFANTNIRTAEMVNWYCFAMEPPDKMLLGSYQQDAVQGFMILRRKEDPNRRLLECVDVWWDPAADERRIVGGLVAKAAACARRDAFERVLFPHFDERTARLYATLGLLQGPAWRKREYVKGPQQLLDAITVENSYFVRAQGDYGL